MLVREAARDLVVHEHGIDDGSAVVRDPVAEQVHCAQLPRDLHRHYVDAVRKRPLRGLVREARLVSELPRALVESVASAIGCLSHFPTASAEPAIHAAVPQPHYRALAQGLLKTWEKDDPDMSPTTMAFALVVAARCEELIRKSQRTELV